MTAKLMLGKDAAASIKDELDPEIEALKERGVFPKLTILRVGAKPEDDAYQRGAEKRFEKLGIELEVEALPEDVTEAGFEEALDSLNKDPEVHGILVFRPLPEGLDDERISRLIAPEKDVDCYSPVNMAKVLAGDLSGFAPCTAEAAIEIGKISGIDFAGDTVTIIGRSMVVGRPLAMMLLKENATVTVCHTGTKDLDASVKDADVVVSAAGQAGLVTGDMVKDGAAVIDIGINVDSDGNLTGDVDFDEAKEKASLITPVPGGVGGATTSILAKHVVIAAEKASGK